MWEVPLETQKSEYVKNNILSQTSKPELAQYPHAALFNPKKERLLKKTKQGFLKTWEGLTEKLINRNIEKPRNTTIGHLYMIIKGIKSTKDKTPDTYLEDNIKINVVFSTTVEPSTTKEGKTYSDLCGCFPTTSIRKNKYIYVMYVYDCNVILTTAMNNRSDKEMI